MDISEDLLTAKDQSFRLICENDYATCLHNFIGMHFGHCVVIPKRRAKNLADLSPEESKGFFEIIEVASQAISKATEKSVIVLKNMGTFITNDEQVHFHIIPSDYKFGDMYATTKTAKDLEKRKRVLWSKEDLKEASNKIKKFL